MTTYVVTVPGTFLDAPTAEARSTLVRALRPVDPQSTDFGEDEELDILTMYGDSSAFSVRVAVDADNPPAAEGAARDLVNEALGVAGFTEETARLGDPVITGIDAE
ncbi:hypothetical protein [Streptomyces sp. CBMA29]|uniref:hypothetical protein n=1 Tax=Streptomyces sp. CBMA29 TaxID=1896314 RepID=UPI001662031F|nr:hypothetical protein [Streptomyces sp. CBMA29]MBD0739152.1 hypothetical protein [Streptomyces sp. CBMA29]